jgi:hypothetical protein
VYAGRDDDGVQDAKRPIHLLNDLDTLVEQQVEDDTKTLECPTDTILEAPCNSSGEHLLNILLDKSDEKEASVTYSVLVEMPRDIVYEDRDIYNCKRDKYLDLLVNHKTMVEVQSTAVGRSNECTKMFLQALKVAQQTIAPYQLRPWKKPVPPPVKIQKITGTRIGGQMKRKKRRRI